jgi:diadenosine tetraphosphate (Ap4A) HIT family hydrolase
MASQSRSRCPFCYPAQENLVADNTYAVARWDGFPIAEGHTLIIPRRHVASFFECTIEERMAMISLLDVIKEKIDRLYNPDGYNIGLNNGEAAGQTVMHVHMHLIPRYAGDKPDPRGGVRWIFPDKAAYWTR